MGCGSGGGTQTTVQSSQPPEEVLQAYRDVMAKAQGVANQPLQQYTGPMVAGFTPDQQAAFATINNAQGVQLPYLNTAAQYAAQGAAPTSLTPFSAGAVGQYQSPYTQSVIDTTLANINRNNAIQANDLLGKGIAAGNAFGGDRLGIAQAELARNQALATNQTVAGLENQGYSQALGEFNTQQAADIANQQANAARAAAAAGQFAGIGGQAQNSLLTGAGAQLQAGGLQQALAQQQLNVPYQQFQQQQAYPYQDVGWLAQTLLNTGSQMGGTSTTTSPSNQPSGLSQALGLGLTAASLFLKDGGRVALAAGGIAGPVTPEPASDMRAQIAAIRDPSSGKDAALVTPHTSRDGLNLRGLYAVETPQGLFVTSNRRKADAAHEMGADLSDSDMGALLGYTGDKASSDGTVIQSRDGLGNVVHEEATSTGGLPAAAARAREMAPDGGDVVQTDGLAAQARRAGGIAGYAEGGDTSPVSYIEAGGRGIAIPQLNANALVGKQSNAVTAANAPEGTAGLGAYFNPLPQIPLTAASSSTYTPPSLAPWITGAGAPAANDNASASSDGGISDWVSKFYENPASSDFAHMIYTLNFPYAKDGGRIPAFAGGGGIMDSGPYGVALPGVSIGHGPPLPTAPVAPPAQKDDGLGNLSGILALAQKIKGKRDAATADGLNNATATSNTDAMVTPDLSAATQDVQPGFFARLGNLIGLADGGWPGYDDPYDAGAGPYGVDVPSYGRIGRGPPTPPPVAANDNGGDGGVSLADIVGLAGAAKNAGLGADDGSGPVATGNTADTVAPDISAGYAPASVPEDQVGIARLAGAPPAKAAAPSGSSGLLGALGVDTGINMSPAVQQALLSAGLGMLASKSRYAGRAIGEGGLAGLRAYQQQKAAEAQQDYRRQQMELENRRTAAQEKHYENMDKAPHFITSGKYVSLYFPASGEVIPTTIETAEWQRVEQQKARDAETAVYHNRSLGIEAGNSASLQEYRKQQLQLERERNEQGRFTFLGPDKNNPNNSIFMDAKTGMPVSRPVAIGPKAGTGQQGTTERLAQIIFDEAKSNGQPISMTRAIAMAQRAPDDAMLRVREERLALDAAKIDPEYGSDPMATWQKYRSMYQLPAMPLPKKPPEKGWLGWLTGASGSLVGDGSVFKGASPAAPTPSPAPIAPAAPSPAPAAAPAPAVATPPAVRPRAVNKATGQVIEWDGKQWVPVNGGP